MKSESTFVGGAPVQWALSEELESLIFNLLFFSYLC